MKVTNHTALIQKYVSQYDMTCFLNDRLLECLRLFHFSAYDNVFIEQDEQHFLYFLVEGQVQCNHYHPNGKLAIFALSNPFTAIGDIEILNEEPVRSNVIATKDTVMLGIASPYVRRYGADDPRFLRFLVEQLREKLYKTNTLQISNVLPAINRLAIYILSQPTNDDGNVILPNKEDFASLMGTTTRHLNRLLKELVERQFITTGYPMIKILNRQALQNIEL